MKTTPLPQDKLDAMVAAMREFPSAGVHSLSGVMAILTVCHGPRHMKEIAERIGSCGASLTGVMDGLTRAGYVSRAIDSRDRRVVLVEATDKGRAVAAELLSANETPNQHHIHEQPDTLNG